MFDNELHEKLDAILRRLAQLKELLTKEGTFIMSAIDDLTTQVAANTTVEQSAITLIQGLADALKAAGTDPVKLAALATQLKTSQTALAAAITANTPAAPPPPAP
jgi:tRNA A37 threonylcarbamoyladenosine dehydratase